MYVVTCALYSSRGSSRGLVGIAIITVQYLKTLSYHIDDAIQFVIANTLTKFKSIIHLECKIQSHFYNA